MLSILTSHQTSLNNTNQNSNNDTIMSETKTKRTTISKHYSKKSSIDSELNALNSNDYIRIKSIHIPKKKERKDNYGNPIIKGSKQHKVSFIDVISLHNRYTINNKIPEEIPLVEVIDVPSYKAYNELMSYTEYDKYSKKTDSDCCECKCIIA